jgi:hypothetical protein
MTELLRQKWDEWVRKVMKHARENPGEYERWKDVRRRVLQKDEESTQK